MNIFLIEDNPQIIEGLKISFINENYTFNSAKNLKEATKYLNEKLPDIIILDISLPDGNGFNFYEQTIKTKNIPTIILTAQDDENDIVKGLNLGAEDYLTKPFSTKELLVRVKKILLRNKKEDVIKIKNITFDLNNMTLKENNKKIELTALELHILQLLLLNRGHIVTRNTILDMIWEVTGNDVDDHTITVYIKRIKDKLKTDIITTIKGLGYRIDD